MRGANVFDSAQRASTNDNARTCPRCAVDLDRRHSATATVEGVDLESVRIGFNRPHANLRHHPQTGLVALRFVEIAISHIRHHLCEEAIHSLREVVDLFVLNRRVRTVEHLASEIGERLSRPLIRGGPFVTLALVDLLAE